jgi:hypothetical protein
MDDDAQHLRWLAIGHYVVAGLIAFFSCFGLFHVVFGLMFLANPPAPAAGDPPFPAQLFGLMFAGIGAVVVLGGWAFAALTVAAGRFIGARRRHTFCIIIAALNCAVFPVGTVLGVFTILVLSRPTVRSMFAPAPAVVPDSAPPAG